MAYVVATRGKESTKKVGRKRVSVVPFVGADREGEFAQVGVGLILPKGGSAQIWGLVIPHSLIQSWRAMKILEKVRRVEFGTLCACWSVVRSEPRDDDRGHFESLAFQFGGRTRLRALIDQILQSAPSATELDSMITALREKGVDVNSRELEEEIAAGRIATSPLIETLIRENQERIQAYRLEQGEIDRPVEPEESLGVFFRDLDIGNLIIGGGFGAYGMDWGHLKTDEIDRAAKSDSFSQYLPDGFRLERTTQGPETFSAPVAKGVTVHMTTFGEIEKPWFLAKDGTKYTFASAKWSDGHFHIRTFVEQPDTTVPPEESDYTIAQLRSMIGPLPKKRMSARIINRLASLLK